MKVRKSKIHSVQCCPKDDGRNPAPGDESRTCVHAVCSTFRRVMHYLLMSEFDDAISRAKALKSPRVKKPV